MEQRLGWRWLVVGVAVVGVVGNLRIKKAGCRRNRFFDRRRRAVRTTSWVTARGIRLHRQTNGAARSGPKSGRFNAHR
jgi:hypothetical protein